MNNPLISVSELLEKLGDPQLVVVDCRFDLANTDWGRQSYAQGHIPGAHYASLDTDLSAPVEPHTGRHPLPDLPEFVERLAQWDIGDESFVVVYDTLGGAYAGRLWWLLRYLGHQSVAVLDGGWPAWENAGYPVEQGIPEPNFTTTAPIFTPRPNPDMIVTAEEVEQIRSDPSYCLIDARAPERYRGETEPIDPVAGHIPGAVNRFHAKNLRSDGTLRPSDGLREQFLALLGDVAPERAVVYCGSGVTSIHHLLAMEAAGLPMGRLYVGSWSEWIRDPRRAVAKG